MKPTVSVRDTILLSFSSIVLVVVSSVANSISCDKTSSFFKVLSFWYISTKIFLKVDLPTLV